jgi:hypothetical protein
MIWPGVNLGGSTSNQQLKKLFIEGMSMQSRTQVVILNVSQISISHRTKIAPHKNALHNMSTICAEHSSASAAACTSGSAEAGPLPAYFAPWASGMQTVRHFQNKCDSSHCFSEPLPNAWQACSLFEAYSLQHLPRAVPLQALPVSTIPNSVVCHTHT